ncbi:MAG: cyclic nucleotide-binding domain-containing protein [Thermodesulfobacteriota bacterium]
MEKHYFFEGLELDYIKLIAGCGSNIRINSGDYIFKEGEKADNFYIIRHGRVALEISHPVHGPIIIETISEGEVLGWSWLYSPYKCFLDARAIQLVRAVAIDGKCLREKCEDDPKLGYELMKRFSNIIAERLQGTRLRLLDLYGISV